MTAHAQTSDVARSAGGPVSEQQEQSLAEPEPVGAGANSRFEEQLSARSPRSGGRDPRSVRKPAPRPKPSLPIPTLLAEVRLGLRRDWEIEGPALAAMYRTAWSKMSTRTQSRLGEARTSLESARESLSTLGVLNSDDEKRMRQSSVDELATIVKDLEALQPALRDLDPATAAIPQKDFITNASATLTGLYGTNYHRLVLDDRVAQLIDYKAQAGRFGRAQDQTAIDGVAAVRDKLKDVLKTLVQTYAKANKFPDSVAGLLFDICWTWACDSLLDKLVANWGDIDSVDWDKVIQDGVDKTWAAVGQFLVKLLVGRVIDKALPPTGDAASLATKVGNELAKVGLDVSIDLATKLAEAIEKRGSFSKAVEGVFTADNVKQFANELFAAKNADLFIGLAYGK